MVNEITEINLDQTVQLVNELRDLFPLRDLTFQEAMDSRDSVFSKLANPESFRTNSKGISLLPELRNESEKSAYLSVFRAPLYGRKHINVDKKAFHPDHPLMLNAEFQLCGTDYANSCCSGQPYFPVKFAWFGLIPEEAQLLTPFVALFDFEERRRSTVIEGTYLSKENRVRIQNSHWALSSNSRLADAYGALGALILNGSRRLESFISSNVEYKVSF